MEASRLDMPLKFLTFGMVLLGVLCIVLTGYLAPPQPLLVMGILLVGFLFWERKIQNRGYSIIWHVVTLLFLGWCSYDLLIRRLPGESVLGRIPVAAMQLSIFLQIFKVYNRKGDRDYVHMFLLSFFQFVSSAGVSVEFYLFPLLVVYLVMAVWALTLFHFRKRLRSPEAAVAFPTLALTARPKSGKLLAAGFFGGTLVVSLLIVAVAVVVFVFFPRSATSDDPLNLQGMLGSLGERFSTGSADAIDLNIAGIISRDPRVVMKVALPRLAEPPSSVLWRRAAMHQYDGKREKWYRPSGYVVWQRKFTGRKEGLVNILRQKSRSLFVAVSDFDRYGSIEDLRNDPQLVEQRYTLLVEYNVTPVMSAFSAPVAVVADVPVIACDEDESFYCQPNVRGNFSYTVFSRRTAGREGAIASTQGAEDVYEGMKRFYAKLPSDLHPRFEALATAVAGNAATDYEKAWAIRNYLATRCRYSLDLRQKPGRRGALYDFLFENRPGHCEYFASAMVILLRELGVPSRLAWGYSTGQWNAEEKVFEVRRLDSHAWAEAFIRDKGWIAFDSTPAVAEDEAPGTFISILLHPFTAFLDFCERQWSERVIDYDRLKQSAVFGSIAITVGGIWNGVKEYGFSVRLALRRLWKKISKNVFLGLFLPVASASVLAALAVAGAIRIRRSGRFRLIYRKHQPPRRSRSRVKFYEKMLRLLMDKGIAKEVQDTPLEFADKLACASWPFHGVRTLTELYYLVRFGNGKLTTEQSRTVQSILHRLTRLVPPRRRVEVKR